MASEITSRANESSSFLRTTMVAYESDVEVSRLWGRSEKCRLWLLVDAHMRKLAKHE